MLAISVMIKLLTTRSPQIVKHLSHETNTFHELLDPRKIPLTQKSCLQGANNFMGYTDSTSVLCD